MKATATKLIVALALAASAYAQQTVEEEEKSHEDNFEHEQIIVDAFVNQLNIDKDATLYSYIHHLGTPAMHASIEDECEGLQHLCSHEGKKVLKNQGHHARSKNNQPIFGILTQPLPKEWNNDFDLSFKSFFEASHADFLQAGGARIVPVDYTQSERQIRRELANLSGLYIPGDSKQSYEDEDYLNAVKTIMAFVSEENLDDDKHYPLVGVSWGMLAMLKSQTEQRSLFRDLQNHLVAESLQQNLNLLPRETFIYDELMGWDLEQTLDKVTFYNEMDEGITLGDFSTAQQLRNFVPVATYDQGRKNDSQHDEIVSTIEGTYMPIFGFSYRIDKVQFGVHAQRDEAHQRIDHSHAAVQHAQHIANHLVDEARLSPNRFEFTTEEGAKLISNHDIRMVTLPSPHDFTAEKNFLREYRTEIYLF